MAAQLQYLKKSGPFRVVQTDEPKPCPDEIVIRQKAIALNMVDVKQRDHGLMIKEWPHVLGIEGAGIIEAVGSKVQNLRPGDEVTGWEGSGALEGTWGGAFQTHVVVPAAYVAKKSRNISFEEAASLPIAFATAVCAIAYNLQIPLPFLPGLSTTGTIPSSVLILGGSSTVGAATIQLLRSSYPEMSILATSSTKHYERLMDLGATHVFDYKSSSVVNSIMEASPNGTGIGMIIDCVSAGASQPDICEVLNPSGFKKYAMVVTGVPVPVPAGVEQLAVKMWSLSDAETFKQVMSSLTELVENGTYNVPLPVRIVGNGLEDIPNALNMVSGVSGEKLIVSIQ